jgi:alpha-ketoglutarate-dependent taurine dioxygenase
MRIRFEGLSPHVGAAAHVDRSALYADDVAQACRDALEDRSVLVFPRLNLTDEEQLAFTDKLGPRVNPTGSLAGRGGAAPDVYTVTLDEGANYRPEFVYGTYFWHFDGAMLDMPLPKATLLSARKVSQRGGQTEFASTYAAYEMLPEEEKSELVGLRAVHSLAASMRNYSEAPVHEYASRLRVERPIVWTHSSGRKSLLVGYSADRVVGMPFAEGRALLLRLLEWAARPEFRYTHHWQQGDLVVWDNCGVIHRVIPYDANSGRIMHRTSIAGVETAQ